MNNLSVTPATRNVKCEKRPRCADIAWVDKLDEPAATPSETTTTPQLSATPAQPEAKEDSKESLEVIDRDGEPGRTRTCNPLIKSQLLYH
jgi:hypothetical protein